MKYLALTILLMVLVPSHAADLFEEALPKEAQDAIDELNEDLKDAFDDFNKEIDKEISKAKRRDNEFLANKLEEIRIKVLDSHKVDAPEEKEAVPAPRSNSIKIADAQVLIEKYDSVDEKAWKRLGGVEVKVDSAAPGGKTKFKVKKGEKYLMLPNPSDRWENGVGWKGDGAVHNYLNTDADRRALIWRVGSNTSGKMLIEVTSDEDAINFGINLGSIPAKSSGSITVKLFKVIE